MFPPVFHRGNRETAGGHRGKWQWVISRISATVFLCDLLPFLCASVESWPGATGMPSANLTESQKSWSGVGDFNPDDVNPNHAC